mgnify:FL=1
MTEKRFVVTGIGTDVGKTVVSAILAETLKATYWKPVQAGDLDNSDSIKVASWTNEVNVLPEKFLLTEPMSPHAAAEIDGVIIDSYDLQPPLNSPLIIEGAGGLMVPLNSHGLTYLDAFQQWKLPVILVSRHYLGSINHTLMSCELLKHRGIEIHGIVFVGDENPATESIILKSTGLEMIVRIPLAETVSKEFIQDQAKRPELLYFFR